jgi:lipoate-protein ligase A
MGGKWRFIQSGACSPAENMAIDEAILNAHSEGKVPPTLRFYRWDPATLSIGYFQKAEEEVNFQAVEDHGVGFVRRPTGGRAVLHDQELTYSMIVSENYPGMPKGVTEAYRVLSEGLLLGFRNLDLNAKMVNLSSEEDKGKYAAAGSAACFDSPSWYELVVEGRKVAGSAQTRQKGVVLQHGSILLDLDIDLLFNLLNFPSERVRERLRQSFSNKAVAINDLRRLVDLDPVSISLVETAFQEGITEGMDITLEPSELTDYEKEWVDRLVKEKYGNTAWNMRR